jgi:hypothetical protein
MIWSSDCGGRVSASEETSSNLAVLPTKRSPSVRQASCVASIDMSAINRSGVPTAVLSGLSMWRPRKGRQQSGGIVVGGNGRVTWPNRLRCGDLVCVQKVCLSSRQPCWDTARGISGFRRVC